MKVIDNPEIVEMLHEIKEQSEIGLYHAYNNDDQNDTKFAFMVSKLTLIDDRIKKIYQIIESSEKQ